MLRLRLLDLIHHLLSRRLTLYLLGDRVIMDNITLQLAALLVEERLKLYDSEVRPGDLTLNISEI
jgi:hypothetical protein